MQPASKSEAAHANYANPIAGHMPDTIDRTPWALNFVKK